MQTKICTKCGSEYPATAEYFYRNNACKDGFSTTCKDCDKKRQKQHYNLKHKEKWDKEKQIKQDLQQRGVKICSKCSKEYPATVEYFYRDSSAEDGFRCECKFCQQALYAKYYKEKHRKERENKAKIEEDLKQRGVRVCSLCNKEYPADEEHFYKMKNRKDGLSFWCKECAKAETIRYRKENYDLVTCKQREYYKRVKDTPEFKARRKIWDKNRNEENRIGRSFSTSICHALKGNKAERHWETLVPYNLAQLRQHLEKQFVPPMSWDNYGSYWEVDHIIPQNLFNFTSSEDHEFQICWSLLNLRPLSKIENRSRPKDGSDISDELKALILNQ